MARYIVSGTFALTAATAKTVIRITTPSSRKAILRGFRIVDGLAQSADEGILAIVMTGGTGGVGSSAATPLPLDGASACLSTGAVNYATSDPTGMTEAYRTKTVPGGAIEKLFEGDEGIVVAHSSAIGIQLTAAQARGSNVVAVELTFEE